MHNVPAEAGDPQRGGDGADVGTAGTTTPRFGFVAAIAWFSALYWPASVLLAASKQLRNDELFTYYVSIQPGMSGIWAALLNAADQNPPLFYWLTQWSMRLPGDAKLLLRVPELAAFWVMGVCLIAVVARNFQPACGLIAAVLALLSGGFQYSYEARPYALVLGLAALALTCWQRIGGIRSLCWAIGLAASLAAAVSIHYYAVLLYVPFCLAEVTFLASARRLRVSVWMALLIGASPLLLCLPLIQASRHFASVFWGRPTTASVQDFLLFAIGAAVLPICVLAVWAGWQVLTGRSGRTRADRQPAISLAEFVCIAGFIGIPVAAVLLARFVTGAYTHRYAIPAVIGLCILVGWSLGHAARGRTRSLLGAAACISVYFLIWEAYVLRWAGTNDHSDSVRWLQRRITPASRVAVAEPQTFFEMYHQAPELRRQIFYIADPASALRYIQTDAVDNSLLRIAPVAGLPVMRLDQGMALREPILLYGQAGPWSWLVTHLSRQGVPLLLLSTDGQRTLWKADLAHQQAPRN